MFARIDIKFPTHQRPHVRADRVLPFRVTRLGARLDMILNDANDLSREVGSTTIFSDWRKLYWLQVTIIVANEASRAIKLSTTEEAVWLQGP